MLVLLKASTYYCTHTISFACPCAEGSMYYSTRTMGVGGESASPRCYALPPFFVGVGHKKGITMRQCGRCAGCGQVCILLFMDTGSVIVSEELKEKLNFPVSSAYW